MGFISKIINKIGGNRKEVIGSVGEFCSISKENEFVFPGRISIGNYVHIERGGYFNGRGRLTILDHCIFAPEVVIMTSMHRYKEAGMVPYDEVELLRPVTVERFV